MGFLYSIQKEKARSFSGGSYSWIDLKVHHHFFSNGQLTKREIMAQFLAANVLIFLADEIALLQGISIISI